MSLSQWGVSLPLPLSMPQLPQLNGISYLSESKADPAIWAF
jgi:hypothetical protein